MTANREESSPNLLCANCGAAAEQIYWTFQTSGPGEQPLLLSAEDGPGVNSHGCRSCHWLGHPAAADVPSLLTLLDCQDDASLAVTIDGYTDLWCLAIVEPDDIFVSVGRDAPFRVVTDFPITVEAFWRNVDELADGYRQHETVRAESDEPDDWLGASSDAIRIPGNGGAALIITPVPVAEGPGVGALKADITLLTPDRVVCYRDLSVTRSDLIELNALLRACMVDEHPEVSAPVVQWLGSGLHISVPISNDQDVDLMATLVYTDPESGDVDPDPIRFTTGRAALWEPAERANHIGDALAGRRLGSESEGQW